MLNFTTMFWLVVLFVATLCAPSTVDKKMYQSLEEAKHGDVFDKISRNDDALFADRHSESIQTETPPKNDKRAMMNKEKENQQISEHGVMEKSLDAFENGGFTNRNGKVSKLLAYAIKTSSDIDSIRKLIMIEKDMETTRNGHRRSLVPTINDHIDTAIDALRKDTITSELAREVYNTKENIQDPMKDNLENLNTLDDGGEEYTNALDSKAGIHQVFTEGIEVIDHDLERKDTLSGGLSHKYQATEPSVNWNPTNEESLMNFLQTIFTMYQRQNSKRTYYDDGDRRQAEKRDVGSTDEPLFHRYTAMTLKDMYLKMGGVCTITTGLDRFFKTKFSCDRRQAEERDVGSTDEPLFHRYTAMTLKDMYLKMGGVCTLITGFSSRPIYVISSCPRFGPASNIQYYCEKAIPYNKRFHQENIIDLIMTPVQDTAGFVYKNVYCAQCNGVTSIKAWSTKLDCDHFQSVELSDGRQQVRILDQFADKDEGCQRQLAPETNRMLHECSMSEVVSTMRLRNHELRFGEGSKSELSPFPLSFSLLMNFGFDGKTHILFSTQQEQQNSYSSYCPDENEQYDPDRNICRTISCGDSYKLVQGTCQKETEYESDSAFGDLTSFEELDQPFRVTLTIRNASIWDLTTLLLLDMNGNLEELLQGYLSVTFNISKDRVQNVTITIFNTSDADSQLSKEEIDIIFLATTRHSRLRTSTLPTDVLDPYLQNASLSVLDPGFEESLDSNTDESLDYAADIPELPPDLIGSLDDSSESEDISYYDPIIDDVSNSTEFNNTEVHVVEYKPQMYTNMSLNISFILYQPHRNRTHLEKSTKSVVRSMSDLVNSNLFNISINGTNLSIVGIYNVEDVQSMDKFCEFGHVSDYYTMGEEFVVNTEHIHEINATVTTVYINETGRTYLPGQYDLTYSMDGIMGKLNETIVDSFVFVCNMPKISEAQCGRIVLAPDEYVLIRDEADIFPPVVIFSNHTYNMSQFEWENTMAKTIKVCMPNWTYVEATNQHQWAFVCGDDLLKLVIAESYLTFILGLISLVCLISVLITYGIFDKLRNLPGINTMNLTLSLFLGEFVFMISGWIQPHERLCSAVGVLLHFLFLASFFWMNIMSYDVYCTFSSSNVLGRIRSKKKYVLRYSAYAWGCPVVIVGICSIIDFADIFQDISIGYGGSLVQSSSSAGNNFGTESTNVTTDDSKHLYSIGCWIQKPEASMAAFGGPMIFVLFSNTVMFIRTILSIRANKKSTKDSIRRSSINNHIGHDDVMLYVKMSTVMGFTWVFGLASSVVSAFLGTPTRVSCIMLHVLGILFIVFNCSQGIFIFFVFVFNRRVFALYKSLYQRLKHGRKKQLSVSSSIGTLHSTLSQNSLNRVQRL